MKKEYKTPRMKVIAARPVSMLCTSYPSDINENGGCYDTGNNDYIGGDFDGEYPTGIPD